MNIKFKYEDFTRMVKEDRKLFFEYFKAEIGDIYLARHNRPFIIQNSDDVVNANDYYIPFLTLEIMIEEIEKITKGEVTVIEKDGDYVNVVVVRKDQIGHIVLKGPKFTKDIFDAVFFVLMELLRGKDFKKEMKKIEKEYKSTT